MKFLLILTFSLAAVFAETERERLAKELMNDPNVRFMREHTGSSYRDGATAWDNIRDVSQVYKAKANRYGNAPGGYATLDVRILRALQKISVKG